MSGPECCSNPPALNPSAGAGCVEKIGGFDAYVTGSPQSRLAVLLASDIFGYEAPLLRKLADKVAAAGYYVVVPDFFYGDPFRGDPLASENVDRPLPVWLKDHEPNKGIEIAKPIIEALKGKGISSFGAAGFCWGAKVVLELAKSGLIKAGVLLHPAYITEDDLEGVDIPISILGAEHDPVCPPELTKKLEQALTAKPGVDSFVKIFLKVEHGWTVRYNVEDPEAVAAAEESHNILLAWFAKHVK